MPLSVDHVLAIEDFFVDRGYSGRPSRRRVAVDRGAVELHLLGDRLLIEPGVDDPLAGVGAVPSWLDRPLPSECEAIGLCVPAGDRLHLGAMVDRTGAADWFIVDDGVVIFDGPGGCQVVDDLCRRRLGLPTEPPATGTDWYWLHEWLADVAVATWPELPRRGSDARLLDIVSVAGWHPAVDVDELIGLDRAGITSFVVSRHRDHCVVADWSCVRVDAMADRLHRGHRWAHQLDDGAFSRSMGGSGTSLVVLAEPLINGCSPFALELIGAVVSDVVVRKAVG